MPITRMAVQIRAFCAVKARSERVGRREGPSGRWPGDHLPALAPMRQTGIVGVVLCPVLVGRRAEVQALESALAAALAGRSGRVVITGEADIGKSRLIRELARMADGRQVPVVMAGLSPPLPALRTGL
jgi:hypothetical protein